MDELITRSLQGRTTPDEERHLLAWRQELPANERRYQDVARVWDLTAVLEPSVRAGEVPARVLPGPALVDVGQPGPAVRRRLRWLPWGIAAASLIGMGVAFRQRIVPDRGPVVGELRAAVFETRADQTQSIPLADGTVVRLAPSSRLQVLDVPGAREVWLEGRAYFAVAKQAGRPFTVRSRAGTAKVLGTRFELLVRERRVDLIVAEGRVALAGPSGEVKVGAGQGSAVVDGTVAPVETVTDVDGHLAWVGRFLVFEAAPLDRVAAELERVYGARVEFSEGAPTKRLVTGWFSDQGLVEVVSAICLVVKAACSVQDSVVTIGR